VLLCERRFHDLGFWVEPLSPGKGWRVTVVRGVGFEGNREDSRNFVLAEQSSYISLDAGIAIVEHKSDGAPMEHS